MKSIWTKLSFTAAAVAAVVGLATTAAAADPSDEVVSLIVIDDVPLVDALRNLTRQVGGNFIIDPRVGGGAASVKLRMENVSARAALDSLLKQRQLVLVTNPATVVARIAPASLGVKPVPASQVGTNLGSVIPLLAVDDLPLAEAIRKLAAAVPLKVSLDPKWAESSDKARVAVSFRWERITARQALAALLDNYDLILVEDAATGVARIVVRMAKKQAGGIQIIPATRPGRASAIPRPDGSAPALPVVFALDDKYELTSVKVMKAGEDVTNKSAAPLWHLVSDSNSIPTKAIVYGYPINGMRPAIRGANPQPLQSDLPYLLLLEAGSITGQTNFTAAHCCPVKVLLTPMSAP